ETRIRIGIVPGQRDNPFDKFRSSQHVKQISIVLSDATEPTISVRHQRENLHSKSVTRSCSFHCGIPNDTEVYAQRRAQCVPGLVSTGSRRQTSNLLFRSSQWFSGTLNPVLLRSLTAIGKGGLAVCANSLL